MSTTTRVLFDAPGPRARRIYAGVTVGSLLFLALVAWFVLDKLAEKGQLTAAKWNPFLTTEIWTEYLLPGIYGTLLAAAIAIAFALTVGLLLGTGRLSTSRWIRLPCSVIVEFFRAVPVLLLMVFAYNAYLYYNVFPSERLALAAVVTGLTLYNGSVVAELVRSGVGSLPSGQREAALAVGLTPAKALRLVLLPQAITAMMPAIVSQLVVVLKDSALGYIITYEDLLNTVDQIGNYKQNLIPAFIVVAAIYIVLNWLLSSAAHKVEERVRRRGHIAGGPIAVDQVGPLAALGAGAVAAPDAGGDGGGNGAGG